MPDTVCDNCSCFALVYNDGNSPLARLENREGVAEAAILLPGLKEIWSRLELESLQIEKRTRMYVCVEVGRGRQ